MKATGIIRRVDDLGRVVIPREIRQHLRIKEGAPLEILVSEDGNITLKKIDTEKSILDDVRSLEETLHQYSETLELEDMDSIREAIKTIKSHIKK